MAMRSETHDPASPRRPAAEAAIGGEPAIAAVRHDPGQLRMEREAPPGERRQPAAVAPVERQEPAGLARGGIGDSRALDDDRPRRRGG